MSDNPKDDAVFERWVTQVQRDLLPKLKSSAASVTLVPRGATDVKFAVELGLSIMLDKPIIAVVSPGAKVPERLARVVDRFVEGDPTTQEGREMIVQAVNEAVSEMEADGVL